jgi:hypothetical protein
VDDRFSFSAQPGETIFKILNVLANDGSSVGARVVIKTEPDPPGSMMQGTVQLLDQQGVLYTATVRSTPFTDAFSYLAQDAAGTLCKALVQVEVGE